ncbi:cytochrome P450 7B1 [Paramormyrops kingsleyae]|uniref:cytochrome P450 7B1 n=1 Tax=Paramormyrops kingsleyae TaxID=1676925 RepID=UPI003B9724C4
MLAVFTWLLGFCVAVFTSLTYFYGRRRKEGEPPLIKGWIPYVGKALQFGRDAHRFLTAHRDRHGDVFTVLIAGKYMTFVMDPVLYPSIIKHGKHLTFHEFSDTVPPVIFDFPRVRTPRFPELSNHIQKSYNFLKGENLSLLSETMVRNLLLVLRQDYLGLASEWRTDELHRFCCRVMFEVTFMTLYGKPPEGMRHGGIRTLREQFESFDAALPMLVAGIPISFLGSTKSARRELKAFLMPHNLASWVGPSRFIQHRAELFEQYHALEDADKAGHHFAILWASVGNTIPAAFWALYHLVTHPEALTAVRAEVRRVLGPFQQGAEPDQALAFSQEKMDGLLYMGSAIRESLRLSAASMNIRVAQDDFVLQLAQGYSVPVRRGDIIALYPQSIHMDPEIFEDPEAYQFDRFVEDGQEKKTFYKSGQKLKYFCMPFGSGSSKCPGRYLAMNEMKLFLALLLTYFDLEVLEDQARPGPDPSRAGLGILLPNTDVRFRYRLRPVSFDPC